MVSFARAMTALLIIVFVFVAQTTAAVVDDSPDAIVRSVVGDIMKAISADSEIRAGNQEKLMRLVDRKVLPYFDFERMTRLAMGKNWSRATPEQQKRLVAEFRKLLVRTYSSALVMYRNETITIRPPHGGADATDVDVRVEVRQSGNPNSIMIVMSMEKVESVWKVYNISVDGAGLVTTYRSTFSDEMSRGGIEGIIALLEKKNNSHAR